MKTELAKSLRIRWRRLRTVRWSGSVLTDYRILKNYMRAIS